MSPLSLCGIGIYRDSTREDQEFKVFSDLLSDLPFRYGSLTVLCTSFRFCIGSDSMPVFDIPGLEFCDTTGKNRFNSECRNPGGPWFRQIIPTGAQLIHLIQEIQNKCIAINVHVGVTGAATASTKTHPVQVSSTRE